MRGEMPMDRRVWYVVTFCLRRFDDRDFYNPCLSTLWNMRVTMQEVQDRAAYETGTTRGDDAFKLCNAGRFKAT